MPNVSPHFDIREFVSEYIYTRFGGAAQTFIDPRLVHAAEWLRVKLDVPLIANDWHNGGHFQSRGYRQPDSSVGATFSQHKFGRALDLSSPKMSCADMYAFILAHEKEALENHITTLEDIRETKTWLHISCQWNPVSDKILIIRP